MAHIHQPQPSQQQSSTGLLAPHNSVFEALNELSPEPTRSSLPPRSFPMNSSMTASMEFANSSWQSVSQHFARPTSSVLSSSDTEEDDLAEENRATATDSTMPTRPAHNMTSINNTEEDDEKTIEIDLNAGVAFRPLFTSKDSSFVMPQLSNATHKNNNKILIIGYRKLGFYKQLDSHLRSKFTLDSDDPSTKVVLVIFDGLIKIGNVLNFIKQNELDISRRKYFIPIFKNINGEIVEKILRLHNAQLLCPPIKQDDTCQLEGLLALLKEDTILEDSSIIDLLSNNHSQQTQSRPIDHDFSLIKLSKGSPSSSEEYESHHKSLDLESETTFDFMNFQPNYEQDHQYTIVHQRRPLPITHTGSSKSILIKHQVHQDGTMKGSKKFKNRKSKYQKYSLLGISLSIGIGIGITLAITLSYYKSKRLSAIHAKELQKLSTSSKMKDIVIESSRKVIPHLETSSKSLKASLKTINDGIVNHFNDSGAFIKENLIQFKRGVSDLSKSVLQGTSSYIRGLTNIWDDYIVTTAKGYNHSLFWYF